MNQAPPKAAMWLLERLGSSANNDAIAGDLIERYRDEQRSQFWCWKQAAKAIGVASVTEVRANKLLSIRAVVVGWVSLLLLLAALSKTTRALAEVDLELWTQYMLFVSRLLPRVLWAACSDVFLWLQYSSLVLMGCAGGLCIGWLVSRLHRPHEKAAVLLFLASVCSAIALWTVSVMLLAPSAQTFRQVYSACPVLLSIAFSTLLGSGLLCLFSQANKRLSIPRSS